jgi:hypothetical protein
MRFVLVRAEEVPLAKGIASGSASALFCTSVAYLHAYLIALFFVKSAHCSINLFFVNR